MLRYIITGLMFSLVLVANAAAAPEATREILSSKVLGEDRPLNIVLPADYSPDNTYPVAYVLDGGHRSLPNMAEGMQNAHAELIVVGVENVDRSRDMIHDGTTALLAGEKTFPRALFMNRGGDDYPHVTGYLPAFEALLREVAPADFRWKSEMIDDGGHVPASTYRNGIAFIFQ